MIFIDFYILSQMMFFDFIRKPMVLAVNLTVSNSLNFTQTMFQDLFTSVKYDLKFTGQIIYMEHYLNDQFDDLQRRIYIKDKDFGEEVYLFNSSEGNEETFLFNDSENGNQVYFTNNLEQQTAVHFEVFVPNDLNIDQVIFRKHVDKYVLAGFNYEIIIV